MTKIIPLHRSIIPACDVQSLRQLSAIVRATRGMEKISAYKVGFELVVRFGLKKTVDTVKKLSEKPVIYDHQKGGTDIPEMGERFASACAQSEVDAVIIFPFTGPESESAWIDAIKKQGLGLIVGGEMSHKKFLAKENGFIADDAPKKIFELAASKKVSDFVVPATKPGRIAYFSNLLKEKGVKNPAFYSPGFVTQGGDLKKALESTSADFHAIIGRAIYGAKNPKAAAMDLVERI
ncbi:MAG: orotidine 5'-phosphate decarboxylase / HUMPS family protein [Patescibacteria group bacterium]